MVWAFNIIHQKRENQSPALNLIKKFLLFLVQLLLTVLNKNTKVFYRK